MAWQFTKEVFVGVRSRVLEATLGLLTKLCEIESKISKKKSRLQAVRHKLELTVASKAKD